MHATVTIHLQLCSAFNAYHMALNYVYFSCGTESCNYSYFGHPSALCVQIARSSWAKPTFQYVPVPAVYAEAATSSPSIVLPAQQVSPNHTLKENRCASMKHSSHM